MTKKQAAEGSCGKLCGHPMGPAKNGVDRGACIKPAGHEQRHGSGTCPRCGVKLTCEKAAPSIVKLQKGWCRNCIREVRGCHPRALPEASQYHEFPCGCSGILTQRGESDKFVQWMGNQWACRVGRIITASRIALKYGYMPIDPNTPHSVIRKMMGEPLCERCKQPLSWDLGRGTTPHLHHNHDTGEVYGFTHPHCNPRAMETEIDRLRARVRELETQLNLAVVAA